MARRSPLFVVTGASGAGKTTIFEPLLTQLAGRCAVFDVDWLIDPLSRQTNGVDWVAFRDAWLHVAHGIAQNGSPTLLLGPLIPEHLEDLPGRRWIGDIHYLVLDCPDDERRRRLEARPDWRARGSYAQIDAQIEFGQWLRKNLPCVDTHSCSPPEVVSTVVAWFLSAATEKLPATGN